MISGIKICIFHALLPPYPTVYSWMLQNRLREWGGVNAIGCQVKEGSGAL